MEGVNSNIIYLIYCKNFCKCHNVSPEQLKKEKKKRNKQTNKQKSTSNCTQVSEAGGLEFEASLGYIVRLCLKNQDKTKNKQPNLT
jgi:hypothetical protein